MLISVKSSNCIGSGISSNLHTLARSFVTQGTYSRKQDCLRSQQLILKERKRSAAAGTLFLGSTLGLFSQYFSIQNIDPRAVCHWSVGCVWVSSHLLKLCTYVGWNPIILARVLFCTEGGFAGASVVILCFRRQCWFSWALQTKSFSNLTKGLCVSTQ